MEFRILGPLDVTAEGRSLPLGGRKQRAMLALLLLHANEVVSADRLIDELWGESPPETVQTMIQVYISRLRKVLGAGRIATRAPGYVLQVDPSELDLERFLRLADEGREALSTGDLTLAAAELREALALWHGPPLADLAYDPAFQTEIARLEETRLATLEDRLEADLALRRHGELVGELETLVADHPLRERLRGQLMLALYRSGRQAEALELYQEGRRKLVEELGLEPGPALQRLEKAILNQEPALEPPILAAAEESVSAETPLPLVSAERKIVTVAYIGLVGPAQADPELEGALVEQVDAIVEEEVGHAGGVVEPLAGRTFLAIFGAPLSREDHAERALHAALTLRRRAEEVLAPGFSLRTGVESGSALVDVSGGHGLLTGAAPDVATRLGQAAGPGEILVGERACAAVRGAFELGEPTSASGPLRGRPLLRAMLLTRPRGVRGLPRAFVGRKGELDLLEATYRRVVLDAEPHAVTIAGDSGVGKTRLVRELWERLAKESPATRLRSGRCLPYGQAMTYAPLADVLREELGLEVRDAPETVWERLGERSILGLTLGLDLAGELHPLEARAELHTAWVELLHELAGGGPVALFVDDLHWAQGPLLELLELVLREVRGPLLLIATARPEFLDQRPGWSAGHRNTSTIWLEPLSTNDVLQLADELLGGQMPAPLRRLVVERAEGNPFFLEEIIGALIDEGVLERTGGSWSATRLLERLEAPASVQAVLAARIDLLGPLEKAALQAASVIGRQFSAEPVRELLGGAQPDFVLLEERDFIRRRLPSTLEAPGELTFKHGVTRDVAYETLPRAERPRLHGTFADWLERTGAGRDEHAHALAHHYLEAASPENAGLAWVGQERELERVRTKALAWVRRAAELAVARYANDEALDLLSRAIELAPGAAEQADLWRAVGRANLKKYDGEGFWEAMERSIDLSETPETRADLYGELALETLARPGMWARSPDRDKVEHWLAQALASSPPDSAARASALTARAFFDLAGGEADAQEAGRIAERLGDELLVLRSWRAGVEVLLAGERYEEALAAVAPVVARLEAISDLELREGVYWEAMLASAGSGRIADARGFAGSLDELGARLTPHHAVHGVGVKLMVEELAGDWGAVALLEDDARSRVEANRGTPCAFNIRSLLVCALACELAGNADRARELEQRADELGIEGYGLTIDAPRIRLALARGDLATIERLVEGPVKTMTLAWPASLSARLDGLAAVGERQRVEEEGVPLVGSMSYLEPFALRALGIVRKDADLLEQAQRRFEALGLEWHAAQTPRLAGL